MHRKTTPLPHSAPLLAPLHFSRPTTEHSAGLRRQIKIRTGTSWHTDLRIARLLAQSSPHAPRSCIHVSDRSSRHNPAVIHPDGNYPLSGYCSPNLHVNPTSATNPSKQNTYPWRFCRPHLLDLNQPTGCHLKSGQRIPFQNQDFTGTPHTESTTYARPELKSCT